MKPFHSRSFFRPLIPAALLALVLAGCGVAEADEFRLTGNGDTLTFSLPSSPTGVVRTISGQSFELDNIAVVFNGAPETVNLIFGHGGAGVSLVIGQGAKITPPNAIFGGFPQYAFVTGADLYTGTENAPTFRTGAFDLQDFNSSPYALLVSAPAPSALVPEPGSAVLLGSGVVTLASVAGRRRRSGG